MISAKRKLANVLMSAAYRLDPHRPNVVALRSGGWQVRLGGVPLANVAPGAIDDTRPIR